MIIKAIVHSVIYRLEDRKNTKHKIYFIRGVVSIHFVVSIMVSILTGFSDTIGWSI